jgi:hypothetical protein
MFSIFMDGYFFSTTSSNRNKGEGRITHLQIIRETVFQQKCYKAGMQTNVNSTKDRYFIASEIMTCYRHVYVNCRLS